MANAGLRQGFVRFGTTAHMILKHVEEAGECTQESIMGELGLEARLVGMTLTRLVKYKFLRRIGKLDPYEFGVRTQRVLVLFHSKRGKRYDWKKKTGAERTRRYRTQKALREEAELYRKASIFAYGESLA